MPSTRLLLPPIGFLGAVGALAFLYARRVEPRWLDVRRLVLRVPDLPPGLDRLRLAHLTDLHITPGGHPEVLADALAALAKAKPALVVLTGDLIDRGSDVEVGAEALAPLAAWPTFAVFGNHDYNSGPEHVDRMTDLLCGHGIRSLRDEGVSFARCGATLRIVGLDYRRHGHPDPSAALRDASAGCRPLLLLTHSAEEVERLPAQSVDLALSGHTHGGQIYVPVLTQSLLDRKFGGYGAGSYRINGNPTYINRGLGSLGIEARFLRRPELTIITFRPGSGHSELSPDP